MIAVTYFVYADPALTTVMSPLRPVFKIALLALTVRLSFLRD